MKFKKYFQKKGCTIIMFFFYDVYITLMGPREGWYHVSMVEPSEMFLIINAIANPDMFTCFVFKYIMCLSHDMYYTIYIMQL